MNSNNNTPPLPHLQFSTFSIQAAQPFPFEQTFFGDRQKVEGLHDWKQRAISDLEQFRLAVLDIRQHVGKTLQKTRTIQRPKNWKDLLNITEELHDYMLRNDHVKITLDERRNYLRVQYRPPFEGESFAEVFFVKNF